MSLPEWNPYQFVPFADSVPRAPIAPVAGHDRTGATGYHSGRIVCYMHAETPVLVLDRGRGQPRRLPASGLKGMVRAVAEIAGQGCGNLLDKHGGKFPKPEQRPCQEIPVNKAIIEEAEKNKKPLRWGRLQLCRTCRIFGFALDQACWQGRVRFADGRIENGRFGPYVPPDVAYLVKLRTPKPHHEDFYFDGDLMAGRKVYLHQANAQDIKVENAKVWIAPTGSRFRFECRFENLIGSELGLLLFALDLKRPGKPDNLRHHYGYGRPAGFGTVRIEVDDKDCTIARGGRYDSYDSALRETEANRETYRKAFFGNRSRSDADWEAFEKWLSYPQPGEIRYPEKGEF